MKVFDFDKTIYAGDSTIDFYLFCLFRKPAIILCLPRQIALMMRALLLHRGKTELKQGFYSFLNKVDCCETEVNAFWMKKKNKLKPLFLERISSDDVIASASPEFLLFPVCNELGVNLIASKVDPCTGKCLRENCYGKEKVRRFREEYPLAVVDEFYSDSISDAPFAELANKSFLVEGDTLSLFSPKL